MKSAVRTDACLLVRASIVAAVWAFGYGLYRWYYALGGTFAMLGTPALAESQWRRINAIAGAMLFIAAALPVLVAKRWQGIRARPILLALSWVVAVACVSHALIGIVQRTASLAGVLTIDYPMWLTIDRRKADLQALFFNEPWFLIEGVLWAVIAWAGALRGARTGRWWLGSAIAATLVATAVGLLSAFGVIGKAIIG